jgi:superfamily II helicase
MSSLVSFPPLDKAYSLTNLPQDSEYLAADLRQHGFDAEAFHAGMQTAKKTQVQDKFMANDMIVRSLSDCLPSTY